MPPADRGGLLGRSARRRRDRTGDPFQSWPLPLKARISACSTPELRGLGMPLRWWVFKERFQRPLAVSADFPMLKQVTVLPELGTANLFAAVLIHEVGLWSGKAVDFASVLMCTGAQVDPSCWNPR